MSPTPQPPPAALIAHADQLRAQLADLVADKRAHDQRGCDWPDLCTGVDIQVDPEAVGTVTDLLRLAIIALAHSNYPTHQEGQST